MPSSMTRSKVFQVRALTTISAAMSPRCRAMRATEDPISPAPSRASRLKTGLGTRLPHELGKRFDNQVNLLSRADGHAQTMRQAISANITDDDAAGSQERVGGIGGLHRLKIGQDEIRLAGPDLDARGFDAGCQSRPLNGVMLVPCFNPARFGQRGYRSRLCRDRYVERAPHPVEHIDHRRRGVAPADAHPSQSVNLGE